MKLSAVKSNRRKVVRNIVVHSNEPRLSAVKSSVVIVPRSEVVCGKVNRRKVVRHKVVHSNEPSLSAVKQVVCSNSSTQ